MLGPFGAITAAEAANDRSLSFAFDGVVEVDRAKSVGQPVGARELVTELLLADGTPVRAGDVMARFSTVLVQEQRRLRRLDLEVAERSLTLGGLKLAADLATLETQRDQLRGDLAVAEAQLARISTVDAAEVARLEAEAVAKERAAREADVALRRAEELRRSGDQSDRQLETARASAESARLDVAPARLAWRRAQVPDEVACARLRARVRSLRIDLGYGDDDRPVDGQGLGARIATTRRQHDRQRDADASERDRAARSLHESERDACDHTPVAWLEVAPAATPAPVDAADGAPTPTPGAVAALDVVADGAAPAAGFAAAAPWDEARGWGWIDEPPATHAARGAGAKAGAAPCARRASMRVRVPAGRWRVRVGFGDDVDWDGAVARVATAEDPDPAAFFVMRRVDGGAFPVASTEVATAGGWLTIAFGDGAPGDPDARRIRAPGDGVALHHDWYHVGGKTHWPAEQIAHFADRRAVLVRGRVHQDLASLLRVGDAPAPANASPLAALRARLARSTARLVAAGGVVVPATVTRVHDEPVPLWRAPIGWDEPARDLDGIAKEVELAVTPDDALRLRLGESVRIVVDVPLPDDIASLPTHLVRIDGERATILAGGVERTVVAVRVGDGFAALGVPAGAALAPPPPSAARAKRGAWTGTIVAGSRTPLSLPRSWGRIRELVPDGSTVKQGDVVVKLYNPSLDEQRVTLAQEKAKAQRMHALAGEQLRAKSLQASLDQRALGAKEGLARVDARAAGIADAQAAAAAVAERAKAALAAAAADATRVAAQASAAQEPARFAGAASAAKRAEILATERALDAVAAARAVDWLALHDADLAWREALAGLAQREADERLARVESRVSAAVADVQLANALEGSRRERDFAQVAEMLAPASGRIFYSIGWNDESGKLMKMDKEFMVWGGETIAEVLDMSRLSFRAELPEAEYPRLRVGQPARVEFTQLDRALDATIASVARALGPPADRRAHGGDEAIARDTVVVVTVDLAPPPELREILVPGTKGTLVLP